MKNCFKVLLLLMILTITSCSDDFEQNLEVEQTSEIDAIIQVNKLSQQDAPKETSSGDQGGNGGKYVYCRDGSGTGNVLFDANDGTWHYKPDGGNSFYISYDKVDLLCGSDDEPWGDGWDD